MSMLMTPLLMISIQNSIFEPLFPPHCYKVYFQQGRIQGGGFGVKTPTLFMKFFQFARVFKEKNPNTPPKFSLPYKNISKPLP